MFAVRFGRLVLDAGGASFVFADTAGCLRSTSWGVGVLSNWGVCSPGASRLEPHRVQRRSGDLAMIEVREHTLDLHTQDAVLRRQTSLADYRHVEGWNHARNRVVVDYWSWNQNTGGFPRPGIGPHSADLGEHASSISLGTYPAESV